MLLHRFYIMKVQWSISWTDCVWVYPLYALLLFGGESESERLDRRDWNHSIFRFRESLDILSWPSCWTHVVVTFFGPSSPLSFWVSPSLSVCVSLLGHPVRLSVGSKLLCEFWVLFICFNLQNVCSFLYIFCFFLWKWIHFEPLQYYIPCHQLTAVGWCDGNYISWIITLFLSVVCAAFYHVLNWTDAATQWNIVFVACSLYGKCGGI